MISRILSLISLFLVLESLFAQTQIAVGSYDDNDSKSKPLFAVNLQNQWNAVQSIRGLPSSLKPLFALSGYCSENNCLVGGGGVTDNKIPFLAMSQDQGSTWFYPAILGFGSTAFNTEIKSTYCKGSQCLAVGSYHEYNTCNIPLFLSSENNGESYKVVSVKNLPRIKLDCVEPKLIECGNQFCVSAGNYIRDFAKSPMIALFTTPNLGTSWTFVDPKNIQNLPQDFKNSDLVAAHCNDSACTVVGSYTKQNEYGLRHPLMITTKDSGKTWRFVSNPKDLPSNKEVYYNHLDCTGDACIATGISTDHEITTPFIVKSLDRETWQRVSYNSSFNYEVLEFSALACTEKGCIIAASARTPNTTEFFFLSSLDQGSTWQDHESRKSGMIYNLQCENNACLAKGYDKNEYLYYPLLLKTEDLGVFWQYIAINHLPEMRGGVFYQ